MVKRLLDAFASDFQAMDGADLVEAIRLAEGRTVTAEVDCAVQSPVDGVSGGEVLAAMGADIITLDRYDPLAPAIAGVNNALLGDRPLVSYSQMLGRPVGINLVVLESTQAESLGGRAFSSTSLAWAVQQGVDAIFLYARPHQGGTITLQAAAAEQISREYARAVMLVGVPSFSKAPPRDAVSLASHRDDLYALLDAGCGCVAMPMPGSKQGWQADQTAQLIDAAHGRGGVVWLFVTGSVEGAPPAVMHELAVLGKQLGADAFRLDEAGLSGIPSPENVLAFSLALRGARHTYRRMAGSLMR